MNINDLYCYKIVKIMKAKCKKEMEIGTNPIIQVDTNSIFDVSYDLTDDKVLLSVNIVNLKINRDSFIDSFEILTEPHIHQSKEINYYPIDRGIYITQFGNIYFESSKCVEILEKEKESLIKNEEYESVGDVVEKISKIKSDINKWYSISKSGEKVYTETFYKIK